MRKYWLVLLILLAACAPAATPQASDAQTGVRSPTVPAVQPASTPLPGQIIPTQPSAEEAVATQPPAEAASGALWLRVLSPEDGETVNTPTIKIKGQAPAETVVTLNDQFLVVSADQSFEVEFNLEEGPNLIEIVASDLNGNEVFIPLTIEYEP